jgi:hypothetical protein
MAYEETHLLQAQHAKALHDKLENEIKRKADSNEMLALAVEVD